MATVKKNNKKKIVVPICLVLVVAIILVAISAKNYAAYGQFRLKTDGEEVTLSTISTKTLLNPLMQPAMLPQVLQMNTKFLPLQR